MARFRGAERQAEKLEKLKKMRKKTPLDAALVDKKTPLDAALQNLADKRTTRGTNQSQIKRKVDDSSCKPVAKALKEEEEILISARKFFGHWEN